MPVKPPELDNDAVTPWHYKIVSRWMFNLYEYPRNIDLIVFVASFHEESN